MNNKKIISATLLVSDGPVENDYFYELLQIQQKELIYLFEEINNDLKLCEFFSFIKKTQRQINLHSQQVRF